MVLFIQSIRPYTSNMELSNLLAENLKRLRDEKKLSQAQLAEFANVSSKLISEIERGLVWPREDTLIGIASALKVAAAELLFDDEIIIYRLKKALKK